MPEAWVERWQEALHSNLSLVEAARRLGVGVMTSGPLGEGALVRGKLADRLEQAEVRGGLAGGVDVCEGHGRMGRGWLTA